MAVEVIRRNVEHYRDLRTEGMYGLQLKAGNFEHHYSFERCFGNQRDGRCSNVAPDQRVNASRSSNFAHQCRGRRFSIRACNGNNSAWEKLGCKFDFADDSFTKCPCVNQWLGIDGNTGANHNQILPAESPFAVASGLDDDSLVQQ